MSISGQDSTFMTFKLEMDVTLTRLHVSFIDELSMEVDARFVQDLCEMESKKADPNLW